MSGEDVGYEYDELQRLTRAASTAGPIWTRTFSYDGFGNLTGGVTDGVGWVQGVNAANNRLTGSTYDGSGNPVEASPFTRGYDFENRLTYDQVTDDMVRLRSRGEAGTGGRRGCIRTRW